MEITDPLAFDFTGTPEIIFGKGKFEKLPEIIAGYGDNVLIITGGSSLKKSGHFDRLTSLLDKHSLNYNNVSVENEPSPELVDRIADNFRHSEIDVITAIGGGSVMDTGKAVSAMLKVNDSVMKYLEGVGEGKKHSGRKTPFIAVPTTSGTGSEATKNAVLSRVGENGFKKSLRHDNFIPNIALLDPVLTTSCPRNITAASGLDALTQLLGAYTSTEASLLTDSLSFKALSAAGEALIPACSKKKEDVETRAKMAYASLVSGITLANAGLGIVHGLASPIGGYFDIPHGVVCGTLLGEATKLNINLLKEKGKSGEKYLKKYAIAWSLLSGNNRLDLTKKEIYKNSEQLIKLLEKWIEDLNIPRLGKYGITENDLAKIAEKTGNKNNPVKLSNTQIKDLVRRRI